MVQAAPAWLDLDASIDKTIALIEEAAAKGAKLIAFPGSLHPRLSLAHLAWTRPPGRSAAVLCSAISTTRSSYDSPQAEKLRDAVQQGEADGRDRPVRARRRQPLYRAMADRP